MANDRIQPAFGDLNPIEEPQIGRVLDTRNTSALDIVRESARNVFKKDAFANSGPLKGVVLRVEENPNDAPPNSWITNVYTNLFGERPPPLKSIKVRIPEIHASLPEPKNYGPNAGESHKIIDMYPTFVSANQEVSNQPVAAGDVVLVDFANRENLTHPTYLGPVFQAPQPGAVGQKNSQKEFSESKSNAFQATPPTGDAIGQGKNPANHVPNTTAVETNKSSMNNPSSPQSQTRQNELDHDKRNLTGGLPPMRAVEVAYRAGRPIGEIEPQLVPFPEFAARREVYIAQEFADAYYAMVNAAKGDGVRIRLRSGFRSFDQQKYYYDGFRRVGRPRFNQAARPGRSNHQNGIAFDINNHGNGFSDVYIWLAKNAHKFGFMNTGRFFRQKEAWHWEFLGVNNPRVLAEAKIPVRERQRSLGR